MNEGSSVLTLLLDHLVKDRFVRLQCKVILMNHVYIGVIVVDLWSEMYTLHRDEKHISIRDSQTSMWGRWAPSCPAPPCPCSRAWPSSSAASPARTWGGPSAWPARTRSCTGCCSPRTRGSRSSASAGWGIVSHKLSLCRGIFLQTDKWSGRKH